MGWNWRPNRLTDWERERQWETDWNERNTIYTCNLCKYVIMHNVYQCANEIFTKIQFSSLLYVLHKSVRYMKWHQSMPIDCTAYCWNFANVYFASVEKRLVWERESEADSIGFALQAYKQLIWLLLSWMCECVCFDVQLLINIFTWFKVCHM